VCIGIEILSEKHLHWRSCVTKVRLTALYMYLDLDLDLDILIVPEFI